MGVQRVEVFYRTNGKRVVILKAMVPDHLLPDGVMVEVELSKQAELKTFVEGQ